MAFARATPKLSYRGFVVVIAPLSRVRISRDLKGERDKCISLAGTKITWTNANSTFIVIQRLKRYVSPLQFPIDCSNFTRLAEFHRPFTHRPFIMETCLYFYTLYVSASIAGQSGIKALSQRVRINFVAGRKSIIIIV
jgi:hypothetical protein